MRYAREVMSGIIPACRYTRLACERFLNDIERSGKPRFMYVFDEEAARHACSFIERMPHTKGKWARGTGQPGSNRFILEPWQIWIVVNIFGFLHKKTGLRRFRRAYICVPRKNGKSILAAAIGLYMFAADNEFGAEVYAGATNEKQAWEVFRPARLMAFRTKEFQQRFGIEVNASNLCIIEDNSRFEPIIGNPGDGASPSCAIADEYHEHPNDNLVATMLTGMAAREQPLLLMTTTAGTDISGPCYAQQLDAQNVLMGVLKDDELFAAIYTIDDNDDWTSEHALRKANPNIGVSAALDFLQGAQRRAINSSRFQNDFKTKHLNIWCGAREAFFNMEALARCEDPTLKEDQFSGERCFCAGDLSSKIDISSTGKLFRREIDGLDHYYAFCRHYLPEDRINDPEAHHYQAWEKDGYLTATDGAIIDQDFIRNDILGDALKFVIEMFGYDPYNATQFSVELQAAGITTVEVPQTVRHLSDAMKWLEALIIAGRFHFNGDPVLKWMFSNVTAKVDANDNVYPRKERAENKIDGVITLIIALGLAMREQVAPVSVYETQGL